MTLPQVLVGENQTILFGLTMLVIAALVRTTGLDQQIYLALSQASASEGNLAGLELALIALSTDKMMQAYIRRTVKKYSA